MISSKENIAAHYCSAEAEKHYALYFKGSTTLVLEPTEDAAPNLD